MVKADAQETIIRIDETTTPDRTVTDGREAHYVEAARRGGHQWWRYLLGLAVVLFFWLVIGAGGSTLVAFAIGGQEGISAFFQGDYAGLGPLGAFVVPMTAFVFFLAGILLAVALIHRRHPRTLITARKRISWRRISHGFVAVFIPIALVLTVVQATTEELFFRGYIVQGTSLIWTNRIFLALVASIVFTLPHIMNPEASAGGWLTVFLFYFLGPGLVWTVVSLVDGTTELAIGAHFGFNIVYFLVISPVGSVMTTPALFRVSEYHSTFYALAALAVIPAFLAISYGVFKRRPQQLGERFSGHRMTDTP